MSAHEPGRGGQATPRDTAVLSAPDTLHGRLQRGLGGGARAALAGADAADLVLDCVCHDPRWDPQCESRATYYAHVVRRLAIPLGEVRAHLFSSDDVRPADSSQPEDFWRTQGALEVLGELARSGHQEARSLLREYAVAGASWESALNELAADPDPAALAGLAEAVLDQLDATGLHSAVDPAGGPWRVWAGHPRIAEALRSRENERAARSGPSWGDISRTTRDELLRLVRSRRNGRLVAVRELGRRQDVVLLELAEETLADGGLHPHDDEGWRPMLYPGVFGAVAELPQDVVVPHARRWAQRHPGNLAPIGLLCRHGSAEDASLVVPAYEKALAEGEWDVGCEIPMALARWDVREAVPSMLRMWRETAYAYARRGLLPAIDRLDPERAAGLADDGRWDSEEAVRETAAGILSGQG